MSRQARPSGRLTRLKHRWAAWGEGHREALRQGFHDLASRPLSSLATVLVLGLILALPVLAHGVVTALSRLEQSLSTEAEWVLFPQAGEEEGLKALAEAMASDPRIAAVRLQSAEQNLAVLLGQPEFADLAELLSENPLPPALFLRPARSLAAPEREALLEELKRRPDIALALPTEDWADALRRVLRQARPILLPFSLLLAFAAIAVLFNTLRLDVLERAEEIAIVRLLGASDGFVQRPFLYGGLSLGGAAGLLAALIAHGLLHVLEVALAAPATAAGLEVMLVASSLAGSLAVVFLGAAFGWVGAWLAVRVHLARLP